MRPARSVRWPSVKNVEVSPSSPTNPSRSCGGDAQGVYACRWWICRLRVQCRQAAFRRPLQGIRQGKVCCEASPPTPRRPQARHVPLISTGRQTLHGDPPALPVAAGGGHERLNLRERVCSRERWVGTAVDTTVRPSSSLEFLCTADRHRVLNDTFAPRSTRSMVDSDTPAKPACAPSSSEANGPNAPLSRRTRQVAAPDARVARRRASILSSRSCMLMMISFQQGKDGTSRPSKGG